MILREEEDSRILGDVNVKGYDRGLVIKGEGACKEGEISVYTVEGGRGGDLRVGEEYMYADIVGE